MLINGTHELNQVRLSVLRTIPITLSLGTIVLTTFVALEFFSLPIALIAAIVYATTPTIVLSNRLSLTENLLTPLVLITLLLFRSKKLGSYQALWVSLGCALIVLTKNIGIALPLSLLIFYIFKRNWKSVLIVGIITTCSALVHPLMGWYYDWNLFISVMTNYRIAHSLSGLPQLISTIFQYPTITTKAQLFPDETMLLGLILLFTSPLWLIPKNLKLKTSPLIWWERKKLTFRKAEFPREIIFLSFPFAYFLILSLLASGSGWSYFGWHMYPLYPFMVILVAVFWVRILKENQLYLWMLLLFTIGSSNIRFIFLLIPQPYQHLWQYVYIGLIFLILLTYFVNQKAKTYLWLAIFIFTISVNIYVVFNLDQLYPVLPQPLL